MLATIIGLGRGHRLHVGTDETGSRGLASLRPLSAAGPAPVRFALLARPGENLVKDSPLPLAAEPDELPETRSPPVAADHFEHDQSIAVLRREIGGDQFEQFRLVHVSSAEVHYPYVRVHEVVRRDPASGQERLIHQETVVADHLLVKLKTGRSPARMEEIARGLGATIRENVESSGFFLIAFDGTDLTRLERMTDALRAQPDVAVVTTDGVSWIQD